MDRVAIQAEIKVDPLGRGYAGKGAAEIWEMNRAADRPGTVAAKDIRRYCHLVGKMGPILASTDAAARAFVDALDVFADFDLAVPAYASAIAARLDDVIALGLLDNGDKEIILGLTGAPRTRWAEMGIAGEVQPADIEGALA